MPVFDSATLVQALGADLGARTKRRIGLLLVGNADDIERAAENALDALKTLGASGCKVGTPPAGGRALLRALWRAADDASPEREILPLPDYARWLSTLPVDYQRAAADAWGSPEADAQFRPGSLDCGHFLVPAAVYGNAAIAAWNPRALPKSAPTPPHGHLAAVAWLREAFRAQAILTVGADGPPAPIPPPF